MGRTWQEVRADLQSRFNRMEWALGGFRSVILSSLTIDGTIISAL